MRKSYVLLFAFSNLLSLKNFIRSPWSFLFQLSKSLEKTQIPIVAIYVKYTASSNSNTKWFHEGSLIRDSVRRKLDQFRIEFLGDITSEMKGNYTLVVRDQGKSLKMTIMVEVLGQPVLKNPDCLPPIGYIWEDESASFTCNYIDRPEEIVSLKYFIF